MTEFDPARANEVPDDSVRAEDVDAARDKAASDYNGWETDGGAPQREPVDTTDADVAEGGQGEQ